MSRDVAAAEAVVNTVFHLVVADDDGESWSGFTESTKVAGSCWSLVIPPLLSIRDDPSGMIAVLLVISPVL